MAPQVPDSAHRRARLGPVRRLILLVPLLGAAGVGAARLGRRSGVTDDEVAASLPGDAIVPDARVVIDRATTLAAPPERVWPWIVQLGKRRAGWYFPRGSSS